MLWDHLLRLSLTRSVQWWSGAEDLELPHMLYDARAVTMRLDDGLYVRLVDLPRALAQRTYRAPVDVVLEVADDVCPWNAGRWRLAADATGATCEPTTAPADLALGVLELGAAYLGGTPLATLGAAGRVEEAHARRARRREPRVPRRAPAVGVRGLLVRVDDRVDRQRALRAGDRDAVMPVAQRVAVVERDDRDGRQHRAALAREPQPLPARPRDAVRRAELAVELRGAARLERPADRVQRDLARAARDARGTAGRVDHGEPPARPGAAAQQRARQRGAPAGARGARERVLGVHLAIPGDQHGSMIGYAGPFHIGRPPVLRPYAAEAMP